MGVGRSGLVDLGWWARRRSSDSGAGFGGPGGPGGPEIAGLAGSDGQEIPDRIQAVTLGSNFTARIFCQVSFCWCKVSGLELIF